ncbi:competence protein CoiA, partial [Bacillus cereus]
MLVCKNKNKERINIHSYDKVILKQMSKDSELFCPECERQLVYCHGTIKIPYFRHKVDDNCELDLSGETEEHKKGKLLIYNFLKMKYPDTYVDLEYKIQETGQRADVICISRNNEMFAFEIQCSKIPIDKWIERFDLYKNANVNQLWIAGKNLIKELGVLEENSSKNHYKFSGLAEEIYEYQSFLPLLDTENETIDVLHHSLAKEDFYYERQRNFPSLVKTPLDTTYLYNGCLVNDVIRATIERAEEIRRKKQEIEEAKHRAHLRKLEIERENTLRRNAYKIEHSNKYLNLFQKTDVKFIRDRLMSQQEQWLFNKLVTKHQYTISNFPGIFQTVVNYMELIETPPILWQLWIYDCFIFNKTKEKNKL